MLVGTATTSLPFELFFFSRLLHHFSRPAIVVWLCSAAQLGLRDKEQAFRHQLTAVRAEALKEANEVLHKKRNTCDTVNGLAKPITGTMGCAAGLTICGYWSAATLGHTHHQALSPYGQLSSDSLGFTGEILVVLMALGSTPILTTTAVIAYYSI